jgi:hypothetical protein
MTSHPSQDQLITEPSQRTKKDLPKKYSRQNHKPNQKPYDASMQKSPFQIPVVHNPPHILNLNAQPINRFRTGYKRPTASLAQITKIDGPNANTHRKFSLTSLAIV